MVKRALLAAQRGDNNKSIAGLKTVNLSNNDVTKKIDNATEVGKKRPSAPEDAAATSAQKAKKPRTSAKQKATDNVALDSNSKPIYRLKNALVESIYGSEEAANKRRIMENKSLEKVTSVREAFEVCFFKAERTEAESERTKTQLEQALAQLTELKKTSSNSADILRVEDQIRQLRAKITNSRTSYQTPIDVLVNIAKFSMENTTKPDTESKTTTTAPKIECEKSSNNGTIVSISIPKSAIALLQKYANSAKDMQHTSVGLPQLRYNTNDLYAVKMAQQIVDTDSIYPLRWSLYNDKENSIIVDDQEEDEDEDDDDDDDNEIVAAIVTDDLTIDEQVLSIVEVIEHSCSHNWTVVVEQQKKMQNVVAEKVADRLMSLFFRTLSNQKNANINFSATGAASASNTNVESQEKEKKEISVVRIGHLEKSFAIGGKSRNRVRNKMKPARNTENVSIKNFLIIKMHEMSDKHIEAAKFIEFMQNFERVRSENGQQSGESMFSAFFNKKTASNSSGGVANDIGSRRGLKRKFIDVADCNNASESLPLPNYSSPHCRYCGAPIHVSSRTGMETCTSPACAATVYMATGFDVVHLEQQIHNTYQYLLGVHMKSTLRRVQGKESATVPKRVKDAVKERLIMERVELATVTPKKVKLVLKKLDLPAWYNHRHKICAAITNKKPYQFSAEEEDVILAVFERLIEPYNLYRPKTDENFPYYRYALHKILQLLGYPEEVLKDFPILKARKNHRRKEQIWQKMMLYLGWPYHKS